MKQQAIQSLTNDHKPPQHGTHKKSTVAHCLTQYLASLGVRQAFGVSGGAIAPIFDAFATGPLELCHFRHESGAAFAAAEASLASRRPVAVFATTGPGLMNALNGLMAARWEGAKVVLFSGATSPAQRGRWATQETSLYSLPQDGLFTSGPIFDFATRVEHPSELRSVARRLAKGLSRPGGFVAHVSLPLAIQQVPVDELSACGGVHPHLPGGDVDRLAEALKNDGFAIWAGFGAVQASARVRELVERSGARIFCSPRAKGVVPEDHPQFVGVTGLGGHDSVIQSLEHDRPVWTLVLGSRLAEATSFWDPVFEPTRGFIHVDIDSEVPGVAYPDTFTIAVEAEIDAFLAELLDHFPKSKKVEPSGRPSRRKPLPASTGDGPLHPRTLMHAVQEKIVDGSGSVVMAECGTSFIWCNHLLRFVEPGRYRTSVHYGSLGHFSAGVVGVALAQREKAVAIVGDGSMLTSHEISTAAEHDAPAVWIVLNDGGYGICRDGHRAVGLDVSTLDLSRVDFAQLARSLGADGVVVENETQLEDALDQALAADGPFVVDVHIDSNQAPVWQGRCFKRIVRQAENLPHS